MTDEESLRIGFAVVLHGDDCAEPNDAGRCHGNDFGVFEDRFKLPNSALHMALLVLGGVIIAVFLEVTQFARPLNLFCDLDAPARGEVKVFMGQTLVRSRRQLVCGHLQKFIGARVGECANPRPLVACMTVSSSSEIFGAYRVAVIGGDGIGPEVIAEAVKVLNATDAIIDFTEFDLGGARYLRDGEVLSDETLQQLRGFDAILLGAVGTPEVPPGVIERGLLLKLRFELDLYINQRPFEGIGPGQSEPHDFIVIRENTEGAYSGEGGVLRKGTADEVATQGSVNTALGVERCVRYAFELASERQEKHLTLVHKTNVLTFAGDLWQRTFDRVATEFPEVTTAYNHVDAACIYFVQDPHRYDVIVTDNLFGDILTDLGGAVSGGIGMASSANLNPARTGPSMFEPVHGSAPDIAGTGKANPIAAILSAAHMLDFLGESDAADSIRGACMEPVSGSTAEIGTQIASRVADWLR